jgi:hypothetical protein
MTYFPRQLTRCYSGLRRITQPQQSSSSVPILASPDFEAGQYGRQAAQTATIDWQAAIDVSLCNYASTSFAKRVLQPHYALVSARAFRDGNVGLLLPGQKNPELLTAIHITSSTPNFAHPSSLHSSHASRIIPISHML